jgi:hypothetical protein
MGELENNETGEWREREWLNLKKHWRAKGMELGEVRRQGKGPYLYSICKTSN